LSQLLYAPRALADLERLADFLLTNDPAAAASTISILVGGLSTLRDHPLIGRNVEAGLREILISRGRSGYVALYRYDPATDTALVLAVRHQREHSYD
jgi:plasmid stabilization system protein ParE